MSVFVNREGDISVFRVGVFLLIFGVIVIVGGFIIFNIEQSRFNSPLNIDPYPGAVETGINTISDSRRLVIYHIPDVNISVEQVFEYFDREMADFYGRDYDNPQSRDIDERCQRHPVSGVFEDYVEGEGTVQYYHSCMFNDSQYNNNRWTEVRIMPGVLSLDENGNVIENSLGQARIEYDQGWQ